MKLNGLYCGRYHFCLARIELLSLQLREEVLHFQVKTAAEQDPVSMTYIVSAGHDSVMTSMSWLPVAPVDLNSTVPFRQQAQVSHQLHVFTGPAGSGKTHAIQADLAAAAALGRQAVHLSLNETPTPAAFIKAFSGLDCLADSALTAAIQISSYAPFGLVNQLLFQLLVEGVVADYSTGEVFALPQGAAVDFLVEVPAPLSTNDGQQWCQAKLASFTELANSNSLLHYLPVLRDCASQVRAMDARYRAPSAVMQQHTRACT